MDDDRKQWAIIILCIMIFIASSSQVGTQYLNTNKDIQLTEFLMRQCLNESSFNAEFRTGHLSITKLNDSACLWEYNP